MCWNFSVTLTIHPSINTSSAYAVCCLVLLKMVLLGLLSVLIITFSNTMFNNNVDSALLVSSLFLCVHASVSCPWIFISPLESCSVILITFCSMTTQWLLSPSAHMHIHICTCTHTCAHAHMHICTHIHTYALTCTYAHTCTHTHTYGHAYACMQAHICTHTYAHT